MWQLKQNQPAFEIVDGPIAGLQFTHGNAYDVVPASMEHRFERSVKDQVKTELAAEPPTKKQKIEKQEAYDA